MTKKTIFLLGKRISKYFLTISILFSLSLIHAHSITLDRNAATGSLSMQAANKTYKEILDHIEKNSEYIFIYSQGVYDRLGRSVSISVSEKNIDEVLEELFTESEFTFKKAGKQIVISEKNAPVQPQADKGGIQVSGYVTDMTGDPLIGVNIYLKDNLQVGTVSDLDGRYTLQVPDRYAVLVYNYIGYAAKEETVGNQKIINVILQEDIGQLDEVVVVGYGTQKKASVVAAITAVEPGTLNTGTTRSISNNLAGNLAGVIGVQRSGEPGYDNSEFWIRGISTFQDQKSPLVLVDGVERSLNDIDISEIATFSVLKDASASAVYGVRGANGVILITTKRGEVGKLRINISVEHSITKPTQLPDFLGSADYMTLMNQISRQDGGSDIFRAQDIEKYRNGYDPEIYPDVNWIDAITKDFAQNTRAAFDISGGSERLRYAFVGAYYNEKGLLERDDSHSWNSSININRFNLRTNVDMNITPTTLMSLSLGGYLQRRQNPPVSIDDAFGKAFATTPFASPKIYQDGRIPKIKEGDNPWAFVTQVGFNRDAKSKFESLFSLEQDLKVITPGLKAKAIFSFDYYSDNFSERKRTPFYYLPATEADRDPETGELNLQAINDDGKDYLDHKSEGGYGNNSTYLELNLTYDRTFGEHSVNGLFLFNQRDYDDGAEVPYRNQGVAGRTAYTYKGRYIAEFNFGYNGSENFAKGKRYGFFPSFAAGWIMSDEPFMEPLLNTIDKIKFRGSYGIVGNDKFGRRFAYITRIEGKDEWGYDWGTAANKYGRWGHREGDVGVDDLTWETVAKTNLGVELGFWNMIHLQVDVFQEKRKDIFMQRKNFPNSAGFVSTPYANFGKVDNKGIDVGLDINKRLSKDLYVGARATMTYAKNKIIEQDEDMGIIGTHRSSTGKSVGQIFGLIAERLFTEDDFEDLTTGKLKEGIPKHSYVERVYPGDIKYIDLDNDGEITSKDETAIGGTENPRLVYGFGININYKQFDFGAFFQGNGMTYRMIGRDREFIPGAGYGASGNIYTNASDAWTVENPRQDVFYPRQHIGYNANNVQSSTWWLYNMSMLRLKNLEVGYSFSKNLIRPAMMEHARIFFRGTNLLTFSKFDLWDPELATHNGLRYPIMKSFSLGLEVRF